eukprot:1157442-Pelagomonas_calceolata.AAC.13
MPSADTVPADCCTDGSFLAGHAAVAVARGAPAGQGALQALSSHGSFLAGHAAVAAARGAPAGQGTIRRRSRGPAQEEVGTQHMEWPPDGHKMGRQIVMTCNSIHIFGTRRTLVLTLSRDLCCKALHSCVPG